MTSRNRREGPTEGVPSEVQLPVLALLVVQSFDGVAHTSGVPHAADPVIITLRGAMSQITKQLMLKQRRSFTP